MNRIVRCFAHGLFVSALACTVAVAEEPALSWQDQGGTLYISGGIGEKELDWIKNSSSDFGLRLLFAEKTGALFRVSAANGEFRAQLVCEM